MVDRHFKGFKWFKDIKRKNVRIGEHMDKKYPMCTMKYTAVFLML